MISADAGNRKWDVIQKSAPVVINVFIIIPVAIRHVQCAKDSNVKNGLIRTITIL